MKMFSFQNFPNCSCKYCSSSILFSRQNLSNAFLTTFCLELRPKMVLIIPENICEQQNYIQKLQQSLLKYKQAKQISQEIKFMAQEKEVIQHQSPIDDESQESIHQLPTSFSKRQNIPNFPTVESIQVGSIKENEFIAMLNKQNLLEDNQQKIIKKLDQLIGLQERAVIPPMNSYEISSHDFGLENLEKILIEMEKNNEYLHQFEGFYKKYKEVQRSLEDKERILKENNYFLKQKTVQESSDQEISNLKKKIEELEGKLGKQKEFIQKNVQKDLNNLQYKSKNSYFKSRTLEENTVEQIEPIKPYVSLSKLQPKKGEEIFLKEKICQIKEKQNKISLIIQEYKEKYGNKNQVDSKDLKKSISSLIQTVESYFENKQIEIENNQTFAIDQKQQLINTMSFKLDKSRVIEQENEQVKKLNEEVKKENEEVKKGNEKFMRENEFMKKECQAFKEENEGFKKDVEDFKRENELYKKEIEESSLQIGYLKQKNDNLTLEKEEIEKKLEQQNEEITKNKDEITFLKKENHKFKEIYEDLQEIINENKIYKTEIEELKKEKFNLEDSQQEKDKKIEELQEQLKKPQGILRRKSSKQIQFVTNTSFIINTKPSQSRLSTPIKNKYLTPEKYNNLNAKYQERYKTNNCPYLQNRSQTPQRYSTPQRKQYSPNKYINGSRQSSPKQFYRKANFQKTKENRNIHFYTGKPQQPHLDGYYSINNLQGHKESIDFNNINTQNTWKSYLGYLKNNEFHGEGVMTFLDGSKLDGNFYQNKIEGTGVFYTLHKKVPLYGEWKENQYIK